MEPTKEHLGLIEWQLSTLNVDQNVEDDLRSAGHFGLLNAFRTWQDKNTAKFETYAVTCIRNAMLNEIRHINVRDSHIVKYGDMPLEDRYDDDGNMITHGGSGVEVYDNPMFSRTQESPESRLVDKEQKALAWQRLLDLLPSLSYRQKYILRHRIHCEDSEVETQAEIASRFKCSQPTIQREEKKLYENLRQTSDV